MASKGPARINKDRGKSVLVSGGASTVFLENAPIAIMGSVAANGATIITASNTVVIENKGLARSSDLMSDGSAVATGSNGSCVGD
jgi:uncharacterized Zn-binding protein involved in type VI secretion